MCRRTSNQTGYRIFGISFFIALITFIVYLPALQNGFVNWDDYTYVYKNQNIRSLDLAFLKWSLTATVGKLWHPLTLVSLAWDYALWGLNPIGYHLTNILLHTLNTFLVFILITRLMEQSSPKKAILLNKGLVAAVITAILFGIHPLHVESVVWISERKDVLSAFFFLTSLLTYLKYTSCKGSKKNLFYGVCLLLFIMALLSKPMAITLPIVLLILDFYPLKRLEIDGIRNARWVVVEKLPFFVLSILVALITIWISHSEDILMTLEKYPITNRILITFWAYIFYLSKMIMPLNLAPLYPLPLKPNFFTIEYAGSVILLSLLTFVCIRSLLRRGRLFFTVWMYYIVLLIPVIGIVKVGKQAAADHYTYLASLGPFFLAGLGTGYLLERYSGKRYKLAIIGILAFISLFLTETTLRQISVWKDSITLWSHEIRLFPDTTETAYANRGNAYYELGNYQQAITDYEKAIEINPKYLLAYYNRGNTYYELGNYAFAINDYNHILKFGKINPKNAVVYNARGNAYKNAGDFRQAINDYNTAIGLNYEYAIAYYSRGNTYYLMGDYQQAERDYNTAIKFDPWNAITYYELGMVYSQLGNNNKAFISYKKAAGLGLKEAQDFLRRQGVN